MRMSGIDVMSAIDTESCDKLKGVNSPFILVLHRGENITESLISCAQTMEIQSAAISGVGILENPVIAYFNLARKQYQNKTFTGIFELISLNGNLAKSDNRLMAHLHVALGNDTYQVMGGHLLSAIVAITTEITIIPFKAPMIRKLDPDTGLHLISTE